MLGETQLHLARVVVILLASIIPVYLTIKLKDNLKSDVGSGIHVLSMVFLSLMLWFRCNYSERSGKKIMEDLDATLK